MKSKSIEAAQQYINEFVDEYLNKPEQLSDYVTPPKKGKIKSLIMDSITIVFIVVFIVGGMIVCPSLFLL